MKSRITKPQPLFNVPAVVLAFVGLLLALHAVRMAVSVQEAPQLYGLFVFIPSSYLPLPYADPAYVTAARVLTPATYSLLHVDWQHVIINSLWLLVFGTPVARRFGAKRFILFWLCLAPAGALAHFISFGVEGAPVIGASAVISGLTAATARFGFRDGGMTADVHGRALSLVQMVKTPGALAFIAFWFVINFVFGLMGTPSGGAIAWQAHAGGFIAGLLLFPIFDRQSHQKQ